MGERTRTLWRDEKKNACNICTNIKWFEEFCAMGNFGKNGLCWGNNLENDSFWTNEILNKWTIWTDWVWDERMRDSEGENGRFVTIGTDWNGRTCRKIVFEFKGGVEKEWELVKFSGKGHFGWQHFNGGKWGNGTLRTLVMNDAMEFAETRLAHRQTIDDHDRCEYSSWMMMIMWCEFFGREQCFGRWANLLHTYT